MEDRQQCALCSNRARRRGLCARCGRTQAAPAVQVQADRKLLHERSELKIARAKYAEALKTIERQESELRSLNVLGQGLDVFKIDVREGSGTSEATPVIVASDWHVEERVGAEVGGLNTFTPEIATQRATEFFQRSLRLMRLLNRDVKISQAVLALLGDFITGNIHGEANAETNDMMPNQAIVFAQNLLISGFEFLLDHTKYAFIVPCHSGNHARTTQKTRFGAENGHSLEYLMYLHLAAYFRKEKRVQFIIPEGMHSYVDVYGTTLRLHHGHALKYGGGVGGLTIPANKKIAQWQKGRHADLDVFGHFHQLLDGGNFICNGSLIGFNAYALSIGASYEPPRQAMFLIDKKRGRTFSCPVVFSR